MFLTSPTEVAKVRLQMQTQAQQRRPSASGPLVPLAAPPPCPAPSVGPLPGPRYRGPLHCLATVAREEGLCGLYKGSSALLFRDGHSFATSVLSYATSFFSSLNYSIRKDSLKMLDNLLTDQRNIREILV